MAPHSNFRIKQAARDDFAALQAIGLASFETLRAAGAVTGESAASTTAELQRYLDVELLYTAFDMDGMAVGYGGGYLADGWLHVAEIDVHPGR